ncbi:hypothetical protein RF11_01456 [Thelohanellus kitauei]|uniref:Uncharacterized protein n=1 Tax=Thelohanellus kitauei TaxID=669202 RepID=A0A0C2IDV8_THEKT|nr:hypothetical protein RF11_01456 [Thelohanellus kitauei]
MVVATDDSLFSGRERLFTKTSTSFDIFNFGNRQKSKKKRPFLSKHISDSFICENLKECDLNLKIKPIHLVGDSKIELSRDSILTVLQPNMNWLVIYLDFIPTTQLYFMNNKGLKHFNESKTSHS